MYKGNEEEILLNAPERRAARKFLSRITRKPNLRRWAENNIVCPDSEDLISFLRYCAYWYGVGGFFDNLRRLNSGAEEVSDSVVFEDEECKTDGVEKRKSVKEQNGKRIFCIFCF